MNLPFTDKQVREAIAARVASASGSEKVYSWNCLRFKTDKDGKPDFSEWAGLFRYGTAGETTHGWVIRRVGRETELTAGCENPSWFYEVFGFYGFTVGNETTNSDDEFSEIVEAVAAEFNQEDGNGLIEIEGKTGNHFGLQFPVLTVLEAGEELLHFAGGRIELQFTT